MASGHTSPGVPWRVAVQAPTGSAYDGTLPLSGKAIATPGSYEIYYDASRRHHHLINPASGSSPAVGSVSVVAGTAMEADALATALSTLPPSDALASFRASPVASAASSTAAASCPHPAGWPRGIIPRLRQLHTRS